MEAVARVRRVFRIEDEGLVEGLAGYSGHRLAYAKERFWFRQPGLLAVLVEVYRLPTSRRVVLGPEHAGCRSWLEIDPPLDTGGATRAIAESRLAEIEAELAGLVGES